jgi:hypothetical protein
MGSGRSPGQSLVFVSIGFIPPGRAIRVSCCRGAVVVGAVSLLYAHVVANELAAFNTEAKKRNAKWKTAKTRDDLTLMGEHDFLQILQAISVIGKNVKQELEHRLNLRNGCGHPNSLVVAESMVSAHLEALTLNVFAKF